MNKKLTTAFLIAFLALLLFESLSYCRASEVESLADPEKVLTFLSDIVDLDLSKYEVHLNSFSTTYLSEISLIGEAGYIQTTGRYDLDYLDFENHENSLLRCTFNFAGSNLLSCKLYATSGSPIYTKNPSSNVTDSAATFMERYQEFTGDKEYSYNARYACRYRHLKGFF